MLNLIQKYLLREFLRNFGLAFLSLLGIVCVVISLQLMHRDGLALGHVWVLLPFALPTLLAYIIPISALCASGLSFGRLASDHELDAIRCCGISLWKIVWPVMALALLLSGICFLLLDRVAPIANARQEQAFQDAAREIMLLRITLGQNVVQCGEGRQLLINRVDKGLFRGVNFVEFDAGGQPRQIISADSCDISHDASGGNLSIHFKDVAFTNFRYRPGEADLFKGISGEWDVRVSLSQLSRRRKRLNTFGMEELRSRKNLILSRLPFQNMSDDALEAERERLQEQIVSGRKTVQSSLELDELQKEVNYRKEKPGFEALKAKVAEIKSMENPSDEQRVLWRDLFEELRGWERRRNDHAFSYMNDREELWKIGAEIESRKVWSLTAFLFAILAMPLGSYFAHRNRLLTLLGAALPNFLVYYPLTFAGEALAMKGKAEPVQTMYVGSVVLFVAGLFFVWRWLRK